MTPLGICVIALAASFAAARRSLLQGLKVVLTVGYFYGIVRAHIPESYTYFLFDAAMAGLYLGLLTRPRTLMQRYKIRSVLPWFVCLTAWPLIMFLAPIQDPMVQLVGLRAHVFFLPCILLGAMLEGDEMYSLALWVAGLTLVALGFALAEWRFGVEYFYPRNEATALIYHAHNEMTQSGEMRIPAIFIQSAVYGAMMNATLPLLLGAWVRSRGPAWHRRLLLAAMGATVLGVLLCASRLPAAVMLGLMGLVVFSGRLGAKPLVGLAVVAAVVGFLFYRHPSLQRVTTLNDTTYVAERIAQSTNASFFDLAFEYPMGNGLGGGGTSVPYFLQGRLKNPVVMENEYARLMLELGIPGLLLWLAFFIWVLSRSGARPKEDWYVGRWLTRYYCAVAFGTACLGVGMLNAVPQTAVLLMLCGWLGAPHPALARGEAASLGRVRARPDVGRQLRWT